MRRSSHTSHLRDRGFTLVELLVVMLVAGILLAAFTGFYISDQRAMRHNQIEVETSQELRTALEQISRDVRAAGKNLTGSTTIANFPFITADVDTIEFQLDANDNGVIDANDANEHRGFRWNSAARIIEEYDGSTGTWYPDPLAGNVEALTFAYYDCQNATALPLPVAAPGSNIARVDISIRVTRPVIGGLPVDRTEVDTVRLRNKVVCP